MIMALERHLRRSPNLRSLNFFHGLLQVSSGSASASAGYATTARVAVLHSVSKEYRLVVRLCPFQLAFLRGS
jgi:hypothetical protein